MHGCFGYLYEPGDVDTLVDYVAQLANDPAKRELFGKAARTAAETRFSWENRMSELFRVWDQVRATHRREKV
jgi:glycosyltransferase involved in cell wall biosynthesis